MNKKANQQIRAEKLINIILLETTALLTKPVTLCSHSFVIAVLVLETWLCYVLCIWRKQGLLGSYTSSVTYFLSQTAQGPNLHTRATQSALARCPFTYIHIQVEEQEPKWKGVCHHPECLERAWFSLWLPKKHWHSSVCTSTLWSLGMSVCLIYICEDFWKFSCCIFFKLHQNMELSVPQGVIIEKDITWWSVCALCHLNNFHLPLRCQIVFPFLVLSIILFLFFPCSSELLSSHPCTITWVSL